MTQLKPEDNLDTMNRIRFVERGGDKGSNTELYVFPLDFFLSLGTVIAEEK